MRVCEHVCETWPCEHGVCVLGGRGRNDRKHGREAGRGQKRTEGAGLSAEEGKHWGASRKTPSCFRVWKHHLSHRGDKTLRVTFQARLPAIARLYPAGPTGEAALPTPGVVTAGAL